MIIISGKGSGPEIGWRRESNRPHGLTQCGRKRQVAGQLFGVEESFEDFGLRRNRKAQPDKISDAKSGFFKCGQDRFRTWTEFEFADIGRSDFLVRRDLPRGGYEQDLCR